MAVAGKWYEDGMKRIDMREDVGQMVAVRLLKKLLLASVISIGIFGSGTASAFSNILVVSGSPDIQESIANRTILEEVHKAVPEADIVYLDQTSVESQADVERERQRVLNADVIVFQYPIYWYQAPAIFKNYLDRVYTFGFAHNAQGGMLTGKSLILSCTSGASEEDYAPGKRMNHTMYDFQLPLIQFADLCGMDFNGLVYTGGYNLGRRDQEHDQQVAQARIHARRLIEKIKASTDI